MDTSVLRMEIRGMSILRADGTEVDLGPVSGIEMNVRREGRITGESLLTWSRIRDAVTSMRVAVGNIDVAPLVAEMQRFGRALEQIQPLLPAADGGITYCADDDGYIRVDGYSEEIGWFRDLLAVRYGDAHVSPVVRPEGRKARFTLFMGQALSDNPRWRMYAEIG